MRLGWALVAGALGAGALAWWLARDEDVPAPTDDSAAPAFTPAPAATASTARPLYRWRDHAGVMQVTDVPPQGRDYTIVDVAALERRNTIEANPTIEAAR